MLLQVCLKVVQKGVEAPGRGLAHPSSDTDTLMEGDRNKTQRSSSFFFFSLLFSFLSFLFFPPPLLL